MSIKLHLFCFLVVTFYMVNAMPIRFDCSVDSSGECCDDIAILTNQTEQNLVLSANHKYINSLSPIWKIKHNRCIVKCNYNNICSWQLHRVNQTIMVKYRY
jgi:hypothetical protein